MELSETAADHVAEIGYDPAFGARPLRRVLQRTVENELSKRLLASEIRTGDHILVDFDPDAGEKGELTFTKLEQAPIVVELPVAADTEQVEN